MKHNEQRTIDVQKEKKELDCEVMLFINKRLYENGHITEEMYHKAKEEFLKLGY